MRPSYSARLLGGVMSLQPEIGDGTPEDSSIAFHLAYRIIWVQRNNAMILPESL
jgi:hypothetical protein